MSERVTKGQMSGGHPQWATVGRSGYAHERCIQVVLYPTTNPWLGYSNHASATTIIESNQKRKHSQLTLLLLSLTFSLCPNFPSTFHVSLVFKMKNVKSVYPFFSKPIKLAMLPETHLLLLSPAGQSYPLLTISGSSLHFCKISISFSKILYLLIHYYR